MNLPATVSIPAELFYQADLSGQLLHTWVQLYGLAAGRSETPPYSLQQLCEITGKSQATLYRHLASLRSQELLSWRSCGEGGIQVSFPVRYCLPAAAEHDSQDCSSTLHNPQECDSPILVAANWQLAVGDFGPPQGSQSPNPGDLKGPGRESRIRDSRAPLSSSLTDPLNINQEDLKEGGFDDLRIAGLRIPAFQDREAAPGGARAGGFPGMSPPDWGVADFENREAPPGPGAAAAGLRDPVAVYRNLTHLRPNQAQRALLSGQVHDLELWQRTLEHWQSHGWNPRNVAGQLELYNRGGPSACRYCPSSAARGQDPADTPLQRSLAAIEQLRRELC